MAMGGRSTEAEGLPVLSVAFRPFFLLGAVWSALALGVWIAAFLGGAPLHAALAPLDWHIHEMLFGFALAAIAGFILTAVASWTGRPPVRGAMLAGLVMLWALGRLLNLSAAPIALVGAVDIAFPAVLVLLVLREILAAKNWRNLMMPAPIAVLGIADLLMYLEAAGQPVPFGLGWRLALAAIITLVSAVAARIIPAFTRNWLAKRGSARPPVSHRMLDRLASVVLHTGLLGWALFPRLSLFGVLLTAGAGLSLARLAGWRGLATIREPLLAILHLGYVWMVIGAALLGLSVLTLAVPQTAAVHALTAGTIGTMVLAVMTRVCRGHTGRALTAGAFTVLIYGLVNLSAVARIAAAFAPAAGHWLLMAASAFWIAAFLLFAGWCAPIVLRPRADEARREGASPAFASSAKR
jgi:uncharacterized protein involved in response to NO